MSRGGRNSGHRGSKSGRPKRKTNKSKKISLSKPKSNRSISPGYSNLESLYLSESLYYREGSKMVLRPGKTKPKNKIKEKRSKRTALEDRILVDNMKSNSGAKFLNLAITVATISGDKGKEILDYVKEQLDRGRISNFIVLCPSPWEARKVREASQSSFKNGGHDWVNSHMIYPISRETTEKFIARCMDAFEVTHYVETNKKFLTDIICGNVANRTRIFLMDFKNISKNWDCVKEWFKRTYPSYWELKDAGHDSFNIIQTRKKYA